MDSGLRRRLAGLTIALVVVVPLSVLAARWQWHRHIERDALNAAVIAAENAAPVRWQEFGNGASGASEWRKVRATGQWLATGQMLLRKSVVNSEVGFTVVTPFRADDGTVLCVARGWIADATAAIPAPPLSETSITLRIRRPSGTGPIRPSDLPPGQINRVDPAACGSPVDTVYELLDPVPQGLVALPWPELTSGPHLSYFVQWILIGCTAVVVYVRVLAIELGRREDEDADD